MFEFLDDIAGALDPLAGVVEIGGGLYDLFRGHDSRSADAMYSMLGASVDPNSPQFKNLAALFEERNRANAIKNIQQIMTQNARGRARGDRGYIVNPERRDEFRSNALNEAFMNAGQNARLEAMGALRGTAPGYAAGVPYDQYQDQLKSQQIGAGASGLADLLRTYSPTGPGQLYQSSPTNDYYQEQAMQSEW